MEQNWFGVLLRAVLVPAAVYLVVTRGLHLHSDARAFVAAMAWLGGLWWTIKTYG